MLTDISNEVNSRVREARECLDMIRVLSGGGPSTTAPGTLATKGTFFILLYAVLEFTVHASMQRLLQNVSAAAPKYADLKPLFLSLALDAECKSVAGTGPSKTWPRRRELFRKSFSGDIAQIDDTVMPTDGGNIKYAQLSSIWETLCISLPVFPDMTMRGRLEEVTEHRNAIAHGREPASAIGARYTIQDLEQRLRDVDTFCAHIIQVFEAYVAAQEFRR